MTGNKRFTICVDSNNLKSLWDNERTEEEPLLYLTRSDRIGGIDNVCELLNELDYENRALRMYKDYVREVMIGWSHKNLPTIHLLFINKIMDELKVKK